VAADLKEVYRAPTAEAGQLELEKFRKKWDKKCGIIGRQWEENWDKISVFFEYPQEIRALRRNSTAPRFQAAFLVS
jgi:transposase-like protein